MMTGMRANLNLLVLQLLLFVIGLPLQAQTTGVNWLSTLPDDTALQTLHIPGTHNSAALYEPLSGTAKCQSLSIIQQLEAGVRFLDLRCRHQNDRFDLYHGMVDQKQNFTQLQQALTKFLETNPREALLISIQPAPHPKDNTRTFSETLLHYQQQAPELWSHVKTVPKLSQVRGKAVLLRRFRSNKPIGIPATDWKSVSVHRTKLLMIQDHFKVQKPATKWTYVEQLWKNQPQHPKLLALNFTSGYRAGEFGIPNITAVSNHINPRLKTRLTSPTPPPPCVLVLDHLTPELATAIYQRNLEQEKGTGLNQDD